MKRSPQAKYQRALHALRDKLGISHQQAQQTYRALRAESDAPITATRVRGLSKKALLSVYLPPELRPSPRETVVFQQGEHGELWSRVQDFHGAEIDLRLADVRAVTLVVNVDLNIWKDVNSPWTRKTLTFTTTHEDFWSDFYDALREDFEGDNYGSSYNVGGVSVAAV